MSGVKQCAVRMLDYAMAVGGGGGVLAGAGWCTEPRPHTQARRGGGESKLPQER